MVYWILFRWQFNKIIFVNIGGGIALTFGSWAVYAVENYLLSLRCVVQKLLLLLPGEFEYKTKLDREVAGISVSSGVRENILEIAEKYGVDPLNLRKIS